MYFCCHVSLGICCIKAAGNNDGEFEKLIMATNDVKPLKGPRCACRLDGLNATCSAASWLIVTTKRLSRFSLNTHLSNRRLITNKAVYIHPDQCFGWTPPQKNLSIQTKGSFLFHRDNDEFWGFLRDNSDLSSFNIFRDSQSQIYGLAKPLWIVSLSGGWRF